MTVPAEDVVDLFQRIARCRRFAGPRNGTGFRFVEMQYANENDLLSGAGASYYGGRWNPRKLRAIYLALSPETATKETYQEARDYGFAKVEVTPRVLVGVHFSLRRVLDLTQSGIRRSLRFSIRDLVGEDWRAIQQEDEEAWTQTIGRGCVENTIEALIAPSARHRDGKLLVVFPDSLLTASVLEIVAAEKLRRP